MWLKLYFEAVLLKNDLRYFAFSYLSCTLFLLIVAAQLSHLFIPSLFPLLSIPPLLPTVNWQKCLKKTPVFSIFFKWPNEAWNKITYLIRWFEFFISFRKQYYQTFKKIKLLINHMQISIFSFPVRQNKSSLPWFVSFCKIPCEVTHFSY